VGAMELSRVQRVGDVDHQERGDHEEQPAPPRPVPPPTHARQYDGPGGGAGCAT
jgi:hypothetical protein